MAKVVVKKKGKKPIEFEKGTLHRALNVPEDEPIPESKKRAALAGRYGPKNKKRAALAFKGALAAGRRSRGKSRGRKKSYADQIGAGLLGK